MSKNGFSLIEMMAVITMLGVIAILASTSYIHYVRKGRRVDAVNTLLSISLAQERYRSQNTSYGTLAQVWSGVTSTSESYYTVAISNVSATTYTVTATAVGSQANDTEDGVSCASLVLSFSSGTMSRTPAACWPR